MKSLTIILFLVSSNLQASIKSISFNEALSDVLQNNAKNIYLDKNLESYNAKKLESYSSLLPSISTSANIYRDLDDQSITKSANLSADLNIFNGLKDYNQIKSSISTYKSQRANYSIEKLKLEEEAFNKVFNYYYYSERKKIQEEIIKLKEESHRITTLKYEKGIVAITDYLKSDVDIQNTYSTLDNLLISYKKYRLLFEAFFGRQINILSWPYKKITKNKIDYINNKSFSNNRLVFLKEKLNSSEYNLSSAKTSILPKLNLSLDKSINLIDDTDSTSASFSLSFNLLNGLSDYSNIKSNVATKSLNEATYKNFIRENPRKLEESYNTLIHRIASFEKRKKTLVLGKRLYQQSLKRYKLGSIDQDELLQDQLRLFQTESSVLEGESLLVQSIIEFCHLRDLSFLSCFK